jgi:6-phosphogluconate dehydrogenase
VNIGMVGLGRMGGAMAERLRAAGIGVVRYDASESSTRDVASLLDLVNALVVPRIVWAMVPAGNPTDEVIAKLADLLDEGDLVVDGGNTHYADDAGHAALLGAHGVRFVDVGTSGGVWGGRNGYALMAGGSPADIEALRPVFDALKPEGPSGFVHVGPVGAGHFAKMVHNGIEYGMMQALGEGYSLLKSSPLVADADAVADSWRQGSVVRGWLLDLLARATTEAPGLAGYAPRADESGEARWTVAAASDLGVPVPVIAAALYARQASAGGGDDALRAVAALRRQFGDHPTAFE